MEKEGTRLSPREQALPGTQFREYRELYRLAGGAQLVVIDDHGKPGGPALRPLLHYAPLAIEFGADFGDFRREQYGKLDLRIVAQPDGSQNKKSVAADIARSGFCMLLNARRAFPAQAYREFDGNSHPGSNALLLGAHVIH